MARKAITTEGNYGVTSACENTVAETGFARWFLRENVGAQKRWSSAGWFVARTRACHGATSRKKRAAPMLPYETSTR